MSVIISRALPDVRDGLKPSQRRILFAMHELSLFPAASTQMRQDCGDTMRQLPSARRGGDLSDAGPHGAAVGHARTAGGRQGNFGSVEGDPPAAMRYTEARLTHLGAASWRTWTRTRSISSPITTSA
jgi:DNA gyrase subunit A